MLSLRRCGRLSWSAFVTAFLAVSFLISVTLLLTLSVVDDSTRPCTEQNRELGVGAGSSRGGGDEAPSLGVLRQLNAALASSNDVDTEGKSDGGVRWRSDVDGLLSLLVHSRNETLVRAQHQVSHLRDALRRVERRLERDQGPPPPQSLVSRSPADIQPPPVVAAVADRREDRVVLIREPLSQQQQQQRGSRDLGPVGRLGVMTENVGLRGFRKALSVPLDEHVVTTLKDVAAKCLSRRRLRPTITVHHRPIHRSARTAWEQFHNNITQYELYRTTTRPSYVDELLKNLASLPVIGVHEMTKKGTQIKLILRLSDGTKLLFKPMRISKDVEANPNHFIFNEMERHHAEIAAFHLDRLFDFRRVPPVAGRYVSMTNEIQPFASKHLNKTFFTSPAGNRCFYGDCKYYCDSHHAVCGTPDIIEGSCAAFLPSEDDLPRTTWPNPWAQLYTKRDKLPRWKTERRYCDEVRSDSPYDSGRRLLDVMDIALFDFLTGNLDRHHYYTFEDFDNFTSPVLTDNGRGFGRARKDDIELLAPIFQCCLVRSSTLVKLVQFIVGGFTGPTGSGSAGGSGQSLSEAMRRSLSNDVISGVLNEAHLAALDRRVKIVALVLYDCLGRRTSGSRDYRNVVIDDGF